MSLSIQKNLYIIILSLITSTLTSQCTGDFQLTTQAEVDNFLINNPDCSEIINGRLGIKGDEIFSLESLMGIKKIDHLQLFESPNITSLHGLDSIRFLNRGTILLQNLNDPRALNNVDTIIHFRFSLNDFIDEFNFLENINLVNSISTFANGTFKGLDHKLKKYQGNNPYISIYGNSSDLDFNDLIDPSLDTLLRVSIYRSQNFSFEGLEEINHIGLIDLRWNESFSLNGLQEKRSIEWITLIENDFTDFNYEHKFDLLKYTDVVRFLDNEGIDSLSHIFTSSLYVISYLEIHNNPDLLSISPLEWMDIPRENYPYFSSAFPDDIYIDISDNPLLEDCQSFLLCKALETYPDSVIITNNGGNCNVDYLLENCDLVLSDDNVNKNDIIVYPNPFTDYFTISSEVIIDQVDLYNASGVKLNVTKLGSHYYHSSSITDGVYYLKIKSGDHNYHRRLVSLTR